MCGAAETQSVVPCHQHWILLSIQISSSVAMTASFFRIVNQRLLSVCLLIFPCSLFVAIIVSQISFISQRKSCAIVGLASGTVAGILSDIVVDDLMALTLLPEINVGCKFCLLELLHAVVIVCLIMYCFFFSYVCMYDLCKIFILTVLLFSLVIMYLFLRLAVREPLIELVTIFVLMAYFVMFSLFRMPVKLQLWFLWIVIFFVSCYWQVRFLDSLQWDWNRHFFPVPGSAIGMTASFLLSPVMLRIRYNSNVHRDEFLLCAVILHVASFVIVRILCTAVVRTLIDFLSNSAIVWPISDFWLCALGLIGFLSLFLMFIGQKLPVYTCFVFIVLILVSYVCIGVVSGLVTNGYFIDEVIALSLIMIVVMDDESIE